jgi:hypothetical protein
MQRLQNISMQGAMFFSFHGFYNATFIVPNTQIVKEMFLIFGIFQFESCG